MRQVFNQLFADFFSTIVFLAIYLTTGNIYVATGVAIAGAIAQFALARHQGRALDVMNWASLGLVIVLGGATILTHDPRFVMMKPSIAHFAIAAVMLRRGWMLRYMPDIVKQNVPESVLIGFGYTWAGLMVVLGLANLFVATNYSIDVWAWFISVVAVGAKV